MVMIFSDVPCEHGQQSHQCWWQGWLAFEQVRLDEDHIVHEVRTSARTKWTSGFSTSRRCRLLQNETSALPHLQFCKGHTEVHVLFTFNFFRSHLTAISLAVGEPSQRRECCAWRGEQQHRRTFLCYQCKCLLPMLRDSDVPASCQVQSNLAFEPLKTCLFGHPGW